MIKLYLVERDEEKILGIGMSIFLTTNDGSVLSYSPDAEEAIAHLTDWKKLDPELQGITNFSVPHFGSCVQKMTLR